MADFTTANLPGSNEKFNTIRNKFTSLKTSLKSNMAVDASSLVSTLQSDLSSFGNDFKKIIPELPDLPDLSLQAELESFAKLSGESAATALASIESKFGDGVKSLGFDLDELLSEGKDAVGRGESIASKIPNITVPEGGGDAKLLPNNVKQADGDGKEGEVSGKVDQEKTEAVKKQTEEKQKSLIESLIDSITGVFKPLEPVGYVKKNTSSFLTLEEKNLVDRFFTTTPEYQRIQSFESDLADAIQKGASESEIKIAEQRLEKEKERIDKVYQRAKEDIVEERNRGNFETVKKEYNDAIRRNEELTLRSL